MGNPEKTIKALRATADTQQLIYNQQLHGYRSVRLKNGSWNLMRKAANLLEQKFPEQDMKDLDVIHRIRSGSIKKIVCRDYSIYNGDWYREHPWFTPEGGKLLRAFLMDMESSNSIINTVNSHNMSLDYASRILMLCAPACDLLSPEGFIRWLKEKMMDNPQIREEVMRNA